MVAVAVVVLAALGLVKATQDNPPTSKSEPSDSAHFRWGPIGSLAESAGKVGTPEIAFDPVVGSVAVWPDGGDIEVRIKPPGEPWGKSHLIHDNLTASDAEAAMVATDGAGSIAAAWVRSLGRRQVQLVAAARSPGGDWAEPTVLWEATWFDNAESTPVLDPHLAVGPDGSAAIAWTEESITDPRDEDSGFTQAHAVYRPAGGQWQRQVMLGHWGDDGQGFGNEAGEVGIDGRGVATVLVADGRGSRAFRNEGRTWNEEEFVDKGVETDMTIAPDGTTSLVLIAHHGDWAEVRARSRENGVWTASQRLAPPSPPGPKNDFVYYNNPQLALQDGLATVVFTPWNGPVQAVTRSPHGQYSASETIAKPTRHGITLDVLGVWGNEAGQALAIWGPCCEGVGTWVPRGSYREEADGPWRAAVPLSHGKSTTMDMNKQYSGVTAVVYPSGSALVLWSDGHRISTRALGQIE